MRKNIDLLSEKGVAGIEQNLKDADQILEIFDAQEAKAIFQKEFPL